MQLQLCTKDEATQQAKPTCTANLGHTRSGLLSTDETAMRFARFGKSYTQHTLLCALQPRLAHYVSMHMPLLGLSRRVC